MKKLFFISTLSLFILSSCVNSNNQDVAQPKTSGHSPVSVTEYTYDGCEYVKFNSTDYSWGGHKGNCSNPIHKKQQE